LLNSVQGFLIKVSRVCLFCGGKRFNDANAGRAAASVALSVLARVLKVVIGGSRVAVLAQALIALPIGYGAFAEPALERPLTDTDTVRARPDQMHQLSAVKVVPYPFRLQKQAVGQIAFNEDASTVVLTPFSGRVTRVIGKLGDDVKRGDPLFEIDSPEVVQAQTDLIAAFQGLQKSSSQLALAKRVLDRLTNLLAGSAVAQREVDHAQNDYATAEFDLRTAEGTLTSARNRLRVIIGRDQAEVERVERERVVNPLITINAEINGTIIGRKIGPGQYVRSDAGEALYAIADLSTMWLKANVPEFDSPLIRVGQEIEVRVAALPGRVFRARINAVGASSDAATRRVMVRSELPNPDRALKSEMFASFKISVGNGERTLAVPVEAVIWEGDAAVVWVEREPLVFERRKVKVGIEQDGRLQINDGLDAGERVIGRGAIYVQNELQQ
jgi:membrane fusion protein, heavy metal efflux system